MISPALRAATGNCLVIEAAITDFGLRAHCASFEMKMGGR
jgi:hypothetical protein